MKTVAALLVKWAKWWRDDWMVKNNTLLSDIKTPLQTKANFNLSMDK